MLFRSAERDVAEPVAPAPVEPEGRPRRQRGPSQRIRDIQSGIGTTGGRGAQKLPKSILGKSAQLADEIWGEGELEGEYEREECDCGCASEDGCAAGPDIDAGLYAGAPLYAFAAMGSSDEPSYHDAMTGPERAEWRAAMEEELAKIKQMGTYELVERPPNANVVGSVWALRKKRNENNDVIKFKARLCAQGFSQVHGIDYTQTASPTARISSFRLILALAAANDWEIHQIDFRNAYLNGELDETIYMCQLPGFEIPGQKHLVWRLLKALYRLKQAGLLWYRVVCNLMAEIGLKRSDFDPGVFLSTIAGMIIIIIIHVDDCMLVTNGKKLMRELKDRLKQCFEIADSGEIRWLLGFEIRRDRAARPITLSQRAYIDTLLTRFHLTDRKSTRLNSSHSGESRMPSSA